MVYSGISLFFGHGLVDLQTIEIEVAVGYVESVRTVLLLIPDLFHVENEPVEASQPSIVVRAIRHVSYRVHWASLFAISCVRSFS
jgi:hypothetical protein